MQSTNNSITLSWDEHDPTDRSVKYLVTFTGSKISNNITPNNNITLVDLDKSRTYRVKVAVSHSQNGTGLFSPEIKFAATRNGTWTIQEGKHAFFVLIIVDRMDKNYSMECP